MAMEAFDLAEHFQTPVFVMLDLDLGMNNWMSDGFTYPDKPINRGKLLTPEVLKKLGTWGRYMDVDGDGIAYRTIPGDGMPRVLHARLRTQRQRAVQRAARRLRREHGPPRRKFETARNHVPKPSSSRSTAPRSDSSPLVLPTGRSPRAAIS